MISVAIAVYNGEKYIEKQLNSIVNQAIQAYEIVITDDSDDNKTYEIIKKYIDKYNNIKWTYIKNEKRLGYCMNFFKAISLTTGDIIYLSDQDDIWDAHKIEKMTDCIQHDTNIKCLCSKYICIDENDKIISKAHEYSTSLSYKINTKKNKYFKLDKKEYFKILAFPGMCFAITKQLRNDLTDFLKLINTNNIKYHDLIISYLAARTNSFYIYNDVLCKYRMHKDNAIGVDIYNNKGKQDRVLWLENLIKNQEDILNFEKELLLNANNNENANIEILSKIIRFNNLRFKFLNEKKIFKLLYLIYYKDRYLSIKSYLGDIKYIFNR